MITQIQSAIQEVLINQGGDFLLATKQEDYLTYRISSTLTKNSENSIFPTQWKRFDLVEINSDTGEVEKIMEAKFHYASDFTQLSKYGEECTRKDFLKLASPVNQFLCEKYLLQFIVHFTADHLASWRQLLTSNTTGFNNDTKYFAYLNDKTLNRINPNLHFRNTRGNIYQRNFIELFVSEIVSYGLNVQFEGNCVFDLSEASIKFGSNQFNVPHEFHCVLWKIIENYDQKSAKRD